MKIYLFSENINCAHSSFVSFNVFIGIFIFPFIISNCVKQKRNVGKLAVQKKSFFPIWLRCNCIEICWQCQNHLIDLVRCKRNDNFELDVALLSQRLFVFFRFFMWICQSTGFFSSLDMHRKLRHYVCLFFGLTTNWMNGVYTHSACVVKLSWVSGVFQVTTLENHKNK